MQSEQDGPTRKPPHARPQTSDESVARLEPSFVKEVSLKPFNPSLRVQSPTRIRPVPSVAVSVFDGDDVVLKYKREFVSNIWKNIYDKITRTSLDYMSQHREEISKLLGGMKEMGVFDFMPLNALMNSLNDIADSYDQGRSAIANKMSEKS